MRVQTHQGQTAILSKPLKPSASRLYLGKGLYCPDISSDKWRVGSNLVGPKTQTGALSDQRWVLILILIKKLQ